MAPGYQTLTVASHVSTAKQYDILRLSSPQSGTVPGNQAGWGNSGCDLDISQELRSSMEMGLEMGGGVSSAGGGVMNMDVFDHDMGFEGDGLL